MLDPTLRDQLADHFDKIVQPVELAMSVDDGPKSAELATFLAEVAELSERITVTRRDDDARRPSFAIERVGTDVAVRFAGIPGGHEFTSFVLALLQVGGHPPALEPATVRRIERLEAEHTFETFLSLSCQNCPDVVQALNTISVLNPRIRHVAIDGALFPEEADRQRVKAVPTVFRDGEEFESGRTTLDEILARLDTAGADEITATLDAKEPVDVLVVGGGPAGAAAAIYAARKGIATAMVAERIGGQVLDTMAIENLVSVPYTEGPKLAAALEQHVRQYDVDMIANQRARELRVDAASGLVEVALESGATLRGRTAVLAPGARWRQLGVPGEAEYRNKGVTYCPHCDGPLFKSKRVAVIGGGNSGVEAAIDLAGVAGHVTLVEFLDELRADDVLVRKLTSLPNTEVILGAATTEVRGDGEQVTGIVYQDRASGESRERAVDGVFVQIGLLPNTEWLAGAVELTGRGEIVVDPTGATSAAGVYAAGDATTVPYKQIVTAMGTGSTAALGAFDHLIRTSAPAEHALA